MCNSATSSYVHPGVTTTQIIIGSILTPTGRAHLPLIPQYPVPPRVITVLTSGTLEWFCLPLNLKDSCSMYTLLEMMFWRFVPGVCK